MNLDYAEQHITNCMEQMASRYNGRQVFDEWAVISLAENRARVLRYSGPRRDGFRKNFSSDAAGLRTSLLAREYNVGDFEFRRDAVGTEFEAFMLIGPDLYLICNNTAETMGAITRDPAWLSAQVPFVELSETVRCEPLEFCEPAPLASTAPDGFTA